MDRVIKIVGAAGGVVVLLLVLWFLIWGEGLADTSADLSARASDSDVAPVDRAVASQAAPIRVGSRRASTAGDRIFGQLLDADGIPVEEGALVLHCVETGALIRGTLSVGQDGLFDGAGCGGPVCLQLRHPRLIQAGPWIARPGVRQELYARSLRAMGGVVVDARGEFVGGATLLVVPETPDPTAVDAFVSRHATTDGDGSFSFARVERPSCDACGEAAGRCDSESEDELPMFAGTLLLTVRAPGHATAEVPVDAAYDAPLRVVLGAPSAPLVGTVLDIDGASFPRARARLRSRLRRHERHGVQIDPDGSFEFGDLGAGAYEVRVFQDGEELLARDDLHAGDVLALRTEISSAGPDVEVTVLDAQGQPARSAVVDGGPFRAARTDELGIVRARRVRVGEYGLQIRISGERAFRRRIDVSGAGQVYSVNLSAVRPRG